MILWKANYGYTRKDSPTNLSDIVFTDNDSRFSVITTFNGFEKYQNATATISTSSVGVSYPDIITQQNALLNIIGDDFYYVYLRAWSSFRSKLTSNISALLPSATLACPNLFAHAQKVSYDFNSVIYIPALKRAIISTNIYSVNADGSLIALTSWSGASLSYPPKHSNSVFENTENYFYLTCLLCPDYNGTLESIVSPEYYYCLQLNASDGSHKICVNRYASNTSSGATAKLFYQALFGSFAPPDGNEPNPPENPYPVDPSGPGDFPPGTFDFDSDPIPVPSLPTLSAANTGFTRIYNPTLSQVQQLAKYLWTDDSVITTIWNHLKQFFENPMDAMIGFNLLPCSIPDGGTEEFALMYIGTGVNMTVAANQFVDVDCGTLDLERVYGSALDQSPYTKVTCFLPYIGMVQLDTDEVMGTTLQVKYRIDIVSGSCVAYILVDNNALYQYSGHCAITIPFSSADFSSYVSAAINIARIAGTTIAGGAAISAAAVEEAEQNTGRTVTKDVTERTTTRNPATGRQVTTGTINRTEVIHYPPTQQQMQASATQASFAGLTPRNISNTVGEVMGSKMLVQHSGSFSGNSGYLGVRRPYLIIERPNMCLPENYQSMNGYPAMITMVLGECTGYTRVQQVQLTGMWATNPEQAEILQLLKSGVVF